MLAIAAGRANHRVDVSLAQYLKRPSAAQPGVAGQHEIHLRPRILLLKGVQHLADAGEKTLWTDLEGRVDIAVPEIEPENLPLFTLFAETLRGDAKMLG